MFGPCTKYGSYLTLPPELAIESAGEGALIAYLGGLVTGEQSTPDIAAAVQAMTRALPAAIGPALLDLVPSYASILVLFDPLGSDHPSVRQAIQTTYQSLGPVAAQSGTLVEIPVWYHPDAGLDLAAIAKARNLDWEQVAAIHSQQEYRVYAIGFAPGFAYLGDVDERLATPRLATPRTRVPAGAVAMADRQTAVYPAASPGGWNLIGLSPAVLFDPTAARPMPVQVGDRVRFRQISYQEFCDAGGPR